MYEVYIDTKVFPALIEETPSFDKATTKFNELVAAYKADPVWKSDEVGEVLDVELSVVEEDDRRKVLAYWSVSRNCDY